MNDISFKIGEKYLYTDEELVEFNIPIFFICRDEDNQKYAVMCIDSEELIYIVGKTSISDILSMLKSRITLRDFFLNTNEKWRILAGEDYTSDKVEVIDKLQDNELPVAGAYFELSNSKIERYIERLNYENPIRERNIIKEIVCFNYSLPKYKTNIHIKDRFIDPTLYRSESAEYSYIYCG